MKREELYYNLASLLRTGIEMPKALRSAAANAIGPLPAAFQRMADTVMRHGVQLHELMRTMPEVFPPLDVQLVRAGEESGGLPETLRLLADWYTFCSRMRRQIISSVAYPLALLHLGAIILPVPVFFQGGGLGDYLLRAMLFLAVVYVPVGGMILIYKCTRGESPYRRTADRALLHIPFLGAGLRDVDLSRYARVYHALFEAGGASQYCARAAAEACNNVALRAQLADGEDAARAGWPVSKGFHRELPDGFVAAWRVGEDAGQLGDTAKRLAEDRADKAEHMLKQLAEWAPRLLYFLILGLLFLQMVHMLFGVMEKRNAIFRDL